MQHSQATKIEYSLHSTGQQQMIRLFEIFHLKYSKVRLSIELLTRNVVASCMGHRNDGTKLKKHDSGIEEIIRIYYVVTLIPISNQRINQNFSEFQDTIVNTAALSIT